jgi:hypothetical protein
MSKVTVTFKMEQIEDSDGDLSYLEQDCFDGPGEMDGPARIAAYKRGDWHFIGVRAVAIIWIQRDKYRTNYTLESPGCYGIESDSDESYLKEVFAEECDTLRSDIEAMKNAEFKL